VPQQSLAIAGLFHFLGSAAARNFLKGGAGKDKQVQ
jgi:hypothetical protein